MNDDITLASIRVVKLSRGELDLETFAIPGVGGIVESVIDGKLHILIQERCKGEASEETGLLEIPAGKIRQFENIFDCLRREIWEETGLQVKRINGEDGSEIVDGKCYRVVNFTPFSCSQNLTGDYPIMVLVFLCTATGNLKANLDETRNPRWMAIDQLSRRIQSEPSSFYPMHVSTLQKYVAFRGKTVCTGD